MLFLTGLLLTLRQGPTLTLGDIKDIVIDFLLLPSLILTVVVFGFLITRTDPMPYIRQGGYELSLRQNVLFADAIPPDLPNLRDNLTVQSVERQDTDGDGFNEWVVFYRYDLQPGNSPIKVAVYDSDRGNPPVLFPYQLRAPNRDYLAEGLAALRFEEVTAGLNGPTGEDLPEILVSDRNQLTIFRFEQNSESWDFPRDDPPRYNPIGFFRGNIGVTAGGSDQAVTFDPETKQVTVIDRNGFERSQLAVRSIYGLNPVTNSYWDNLETLGSEQPANPVLAAPIVSTVDFFSGPPDDIWDTTYPEKIVLAFYTSTCGEVDNSLCMNEVEWNPRDFLASDALQEYDNGNPGYFGLPSFSGLQNISVSNLRYYPRVETDPDLLVTGGGRDVVTGEEPRFNIVDIGLVFADRLEALRYEMGQVEGQWKIVRRVGTLDPLVLEAPVEIDVSQ
jgi:hypothetical protein